MWCRARLPTALCLAILLFPRLAPGQVSGGPRVQADSFRVQLYTLQHQPASEAVALVRPLLSVRGTVELRPGGNTLVIRDNLAALSRILTLLRSFDHPPQALELEIQMVRASTDSGPGDDGNQVPPDLMKKLRGLLRYDSFRLLAETRIKAWEGEEFSHRLGSEFETSFKLGTVLADRRIKLRGFRVLRHPGTEAEKQLIHTNMNLWLDQTLALGFAQSEASKHALIVVLTCRMPSGRADSGGGP
jgi:hypothetical protein